jgi:hypothetical protein
VPAHDAGMWNPTVSIDHSHSALPLVGVVYKLVSHSYVSTFVSLMVIFRQFDGDLHQSWIAELFSFNIRPGRFFLIQYLTLTLTTNQLTSNL